MSRSALTRQPHKHRPVPQLPSQIHSQQQFAAAMSTNPALNNVTTTYPTPTITAMNVGYQYYPYSGMVMSTPNVGGTAGGDTSSASANSAAVGVGSGGQQQQQQQQVAMTPELMAYYTQYYQHAAAMAALADPSQMAQASQVEEEGKTKEVLPIHGNSSTYNINSLLYNNILESEYFKALYQLRTYHEVIDEIYASVTQVEPWQTGTSRNPSTAFCLLVKFFLMRLTKKQMIGLLNTDDSPFVRCIGFLYLRYSCPPKDLWSWFEPYLEDPEEFAPFSDKSLVLTMGQYLIRLLTEMQYFNTTLPRIPVPIERKYKVLLLILSNRQERRLKNQKDEERGKFCKGAKVRAIYSDEENEPAWYDATIDSRDREGEEASFGGGHKYWVTFTEYGNTSSVDLGDIELLEKRSVSPSPGRGKRGASSSRSRSRSRSRSTEKKLLNENPKDLLTQVLDQERQGSVAVGKHYASRPVSYKSSLSLQLDRYTTRQKSPSRTYSERDRERDRDRDRERDRRPRGRSRSRDRDRDREGGRSRDQHDRDNTSSSSMTTSSSQSHAAIERLKKLKETYGDASANSNL